MWAGTYRDLDGLLGSITDYRRIDAVARRKLKCKCGPEVGVRPNLVAREFDKHVAADRHAPAVDGRLVVGALERLPVRAIIEYLDDENAARPVEVVGLGDGRRHLEERDAEKRVVVIARLDELRENATRQQRRDGEADTGARAGDVDTGHLAVHRHQWSAAVAGVKSGVGLDRIRNREVRYGILQGAVSSADDARRHRRLEPEGTPECQYFGADWWHIFDERKRGGVVGNVRRKDGEVGENVSRSHARLAPLAVLEANVDRTGVLNHVLVCHDVAVVDESGATGLGVADEGDRVDSRLVDRRVLCSGLAAVLCGCDRLWGLPTAGRTARQTGCQGRRTREETTARWLFHTPPSESCRMCSSAPAHSGVKAAPPFILVPHVVYWTMSDDEDLRTEVQSLREEVDALQRRLDALEDRTDERTDSLADPSDEPPGEQPADAHPRPAAEDSSGPADELKPAVQRVADAESSDTGGRDWELAVGVRWLGVVGALALVVGVVFFVRLAIEQGWLGPLGRVVAGTLGGLLLFVGGRFAAERQSYVRWGRTTAGAGFAITYFSLYAAYGFESYREVLGTPLWAILALLTLLVAGVAVVSVRDGAPLVAAETFFFGYVTAYLSLDAVTPVVTPIYALLLAFGVVAIAVVEPWRRLVAGSVFGTYTVVAIWVLDAEPTEATIAAVALVAFGLYLAGVYALRREDRFAGRFYGIEVGTTTFLNAAFAALLLEIAVRNGVESYDLAGLGAAVVAVALAGFYLLTDRQPVSVFDWQPLRRDGTAAAFSVVLGAIALGAATGTFLTTVGSIGVVCLAVATAHHDGSPAFRVGAHAVAAGVLVKLLVVDADELAAFDAAEPMATLTGRPVAFLAGIVAFYGLAWFFSRAATGLLEAESRPQLPIEAVYAIAATGLTVVAFGLELSGLGISVAWALFGFALLGVGFTADRRGVRLLGIGVLGLTTAKVFLVDTTGLDTLARTLAFLVLGAVLLAASYIYARSRGGVDLGIGPFGRSED